jgi:hypothetical protein
MKSKTTTHKTVSSFIDGVAYDRTNLILTVAFRNGTLVQYSRVGHAVAKDFLDAESKGKFWNSRIRDNYEHLQAE